jgi:malate synthase
VWQWIRHRATLDDGHALDAERFHRVLAEEMARVRGEVGETRFLDGRFAEACALFDRLSTAAAFEEFLTLPAYDQLLALTGSRFR